MSLHKHALIRYRIIDSMLRNKHQPYPNLEEIRSKCEDALFGSDWGEHISISTIEKDFKAMRDDAELGFFAPIKYSRIHHGYYYIEEDYTIHNIPLKSEDIDAIKFASNTLMSFRESPMFNQFKFAIEKIFDRLNISNEVQDERLDKLVQFDAYPDYPGKEHLSRIYQAIKDYHQIEINYQKFGQKTETKRKVHPYVLKEYRHRWYVLAFSPSKERLITFALDRIKSVDLLDADFVIQPSFDPVAYFEHSFGITHVNGDPVVVELEFPIHQKGYITTQPLHKSQVIIQENEDCFIVQLTVYPTYELTEKILGYGPSVKIIKPEILKQEIITAYEKALANYNLKS